VFSTWPLHAADCHACNPLHNNAEQRTLSGSVMAKRILSGPTASKIRRRAAQPLSVVCDCHQRRQWGPPLMLYEAQHPS